LEILIKSRAEIEEMIFIPNTALISITDANWNFAELRNKPDYLLQLEFDDIDGYVFEDELGQDYTDEERKQVEEKYHMLSDEQAKQIVDFYFEICDKVETIICQCEHGQSRSAAVAAAFIEYKYNRGIDIFAHDDYTPNKIIFRKIIKELVYRH
jgi:predicted protein tyrosine phosphatase